jgi:hypothetical protein
MMMHFAWRVVVEIIEADFTPGDDFRVPGEAGELIEMLLRRLLCFMGMDADAAVDPVVLFGVWQRRIEFFRARTGADGQQILHAGFAGTLQHGVAVVRKLREVYVSV